MSLAYAGLLTTRKQRQLALKRWRNDAVCEKMMRVDLQMEELQWRVSEPFVGYSYFVMLLIGFYGSTLGTASEWAWGAQTINTIMGRQGDWPPTPQSSQGTQFFKCS